MDKVLRVNPGDLWAIDIGKAQRFFACEGEPRTLASVGMASRHPSEETPASSTAVIPIVGPIAKDTWIAMWGGTSALSTQAAIQDARAGRADGTIDSIFLLIDSPGGEVAGLEELVAEVAAAAREMPVHAHIDDLGASAAYWVASQANSVSANSSALVGSIGAIAQVADMSKALEDAGIVVHTIRSGDKKAALAGPEITDEALADLQVLIDATAARFMDNVQDGRGFGAAVREDVSDARIMSADEAHNLGLIDTIQSRQAAFDGFRGGVDTKARTGRRAMAAREETARLRAAAGLRPIR